MNDYFWGNTHPSVIYDLFVVTQMVLDTLILDEDSLAFKVLQKYASEECRFLEEAKQLTLNFD